MHSFQSLGTLDGPGIRCVIFLQGCPLHCLYCHNPDARPFSGGQEVTVDELMHRIRRCRPYFGPHGGVTLSGGEALCQAAFAAELFTRCRADGIHTALDTSGCLLDDGVQQLLRVTDLCLLDVKATDESSYHSLCGGSLAQTLTFLQALERHGVATWIRQVTVPGLTDSDAQIQRLKALIAPYRCVVRRELLPFRKLCQSKYDSLGIPFPLAQTPEPDPETMQRLQTLLDKPDEAKTKPKRTRQ